MGITIVHTVIKLMLIYKSLKGMQELVKEISKIILNRNKLSKYAQNLKMY